MEINSRGLRMKILSTVQRCPRAANNDKLLIAEIWTDEGWDVYSSVYQNLLKVSSPESIRRTRQKLAEEGLLKPSEEATERRYQEFKKVRMAI